MSVAAPTGARRLLDDLRTAATMPRVQVVLSHGEAREDALLQAFRRPHPRYRIVGTKVVGVALLSLDEFADADAYLAAFRTARKGARRAEKLGYTVGVFDPEARRPDLHAIHMSLAERQGRPIDPEYRDPDAIPVRGPGVDYVGVFQEGVVVGYCRVDYAGEIAGLGRIMGHGAHLKNGIMFLLIAGIVGHVRSTSTRTRYLVYDTFFGASAGLREFKMHTGFRPHYVRWTREVDGRNDPARG